jgi:uncharacterized protein YggE
MRNGWMVVVGLALVVGGGRLLSAQQIQVSPNNRTIAVTTTESAERRADTAVVHIGYQLYGPNSDAVTEAAGKASKAIADAEKQLGVAADAIASEGQSTGPVDGNQENDLSPDEKANRKFQAQQSWTVKTTADGAAKVLAAAVAAGANQSGAVDWSVADEGSLSAEAAGKALKHAHEIAEQMAAGLGAKLGPLVYASNEAEAIRVLPMMLRQGVLGGMGGGFGEAGLAAKILNLSAPMVTRSATVSAVFSIQ